MSRSRLRLRRRERDGAGLGAGSWIADRYVLGDALALGGSSVIHRAEDRLLGRSVAAKVFRPDLMDRIDPDRLVREAVILASLAHPAVPAIFDAGEEDGTPYLLMELIEGRSLADLIPVGGIERVEDGLRWGIQACEGLTYLHEHGVVHGDIKPRNILVTERGQVKIVDLGIARAARASDPASHGLVTGTAQYLAPEVAAGGAVSPRSDLYSLGVVLYRLFTGRLPFEGANLGELMARQQGDQPRSPDLFRPELPPPLVAVVMQLLAKSPAERCSDARAVAVELAACRGRGSPDSRGGPEGCASSA